MAKKVALPTIVSQVPNDLREFFKRVREALSNSVTVDTLEDIGLVEIGKGGTITPVPQGSKVDYSPPPAPVNVAAYGAIKTIMVQWSDPHYSNLAYAEVWRSTIDDIGTAVRIGATKTTMYPDYVDPGSTFYYWVRFVSLAGVNGAFQSTAGIEGSTSIDPEAVIDILQDNSLYLNAPLYYQENTVVINGVTVPAGTYIHTAYIAQGSIGKLQIGQAVIDTGHVNELSVSKLTSGTITGQYITVGIGGNIRSGQTAFNNGDGFWLGRGQDGYTRFSVGSPDHAGLDYDQSTGVMRFRGIMDLKSGSVFGGISTDTLSGWIYSAARWDFANDGSLEGWEAVGGTIAVAGGAMTLTASADNPYISVTGLTIKGGEFSKIKAKIRRVAGGEVWAGIAQHSTASHAFSDLYRQSAAIPVPFKIGDDAVVEWSMDSLEVGGTDWKNNTITGLLLKFFADQDSVIAIDWIAVENNDQKLNGVNIHADSSIVTGSTVPSIGNKFSVLSGGDITFYDYYDSGWHEYKALKKVIDGTCSDGQVVNVGYFREQPKIIMSPKSLDSYIATYAAQSQRFVLEATNLRKVGSEWLFDASCKLVLSDSAGGGWTSGRVSGSINYNYNYQSYNPSPLRLYTNQSPNFPANTKTVAATVRIWRNCYVIKNDYYTPGEYQEHIIVFMYSGMLCWSWMEYFTAETGWLPVAPQSINGTVFGEERTDLFFSVTSPYDILVIRAVADFHGQWAPANDDPHYEWEGVQQNLAQGIQIVATTNLISGAVISLGGQANFMAVGK